RDALLGSRHGAGHLEGRRGPRVRSVLAGAHATEAPRRRPGAAHREGHHRRALRPHLVGQRAGARRHVLLHHSVGGAGGGAAPDPSLAPASGSIVADQIVARPPAESAYICSGAAMPSRLRPLLSTMRALSARARRAALASAFSTNTRFSRSWFPAVYQRLKAEATSSR